MRIIDFRSDTVTLPTEEMREAMHRAEVGDDVFGEDPSVNELEDLAAQITGKEAALFVASGTMGNLVSLLAHCGRGDEIILGDKSHIFLNEAGGASALGGIHPHLLPNEPDGTITPDEIEAAIRSDNIHYPQTRLICLENTHNRCYGAALTVSYMDQVAKIAERHRLAVHLDGARIFNAAVALGVDVPELTRQADSLNICLSKGLAAPVGSLVCGTRGFIARARRIRKQLGGGMRQAGILAAAGIVALTGMVDRLAEDHENAKNLAEGLAQIEGLAVEPGLVQTNIVYCDLSAGGPLTAAEFQRRLNGLGVKVLCTGGNRFRLLTHYGISRADIEAALDLIRHLLRP